MEKKTRELKSEYFVYVAFDGTEFAYEEDCKRYENSAEGVLLNRLSEIAIKREDGSQSVDFIVDESGDGNYKCLVPKTVEDINTLNQLWYLYGGKNKKADGEALFNPSDIDTPIMLGYRLNGSDIDWLWFWKLTEIVNTSTLGTFRIAKG